MCSSIISNTKGKLFLLAMVIDILNLGEQLGMYFVQKSLELEGNQERFIFYIFIGINGASLFKAFASNKVAESVISALIEIGELFGYLFGLPERSTTIIAVALVFSAIELVLHIIYSSLALKEICDQKDQKKKNEQARQRPIMISETGTSQHDENTAANDDGYCWKTCSSLLTRFFGFIGVVVTPILTLFVDPSSRFRRVFYEILLLLSFFFSGQLCGINTRTKSQLKEIMMQMKLQTEMQSNDIDAIKLIKNHYKSIFAEMNSLQKWWNIIILCITLLLAFLILPIVWIALSSLELRDHGQNLPSYDRGLYIYMLVANSFFLISMYTCVIPCSVLILLIQKWMQNFQKAQHENE